MNTLPWIPVIVAAAALQVARNGLQRSLLKEAGPWGATLVRFLFGLPWSAAWLALMLAIGDRAALAPTSAAFWMGCVTGAAAQAGATAALLVSMERSNFAVATTLQNASLIFAAMIGVFMLGDVLAWPAWAGVGVATLGIVLVSAPKKSAPREGEGAFLGLLAGFLFALSANAFRLGAVSVAPGAPVLGAAATLTAVQALQSAAIASYLAIRAPLALKATFRAWGVSSAAGLAGSAASGLWFTAMAAIPVAAVKAIGLVEIPIAAWAGGRFFNERLSLRQLAGVALTVLGVALTAVFI